MKKFIKELENRGIIERLVNSVRKYGRDEVNISIVSIIMQVEMSKDNDLFEVFMDEVHEIAFNTVIEYVNNQIHEAEKTDALKSVDPDALFAKATEKGDSGLKKSNEEALEDAIVGGFVDFLNGIADIFNK